jgi:hypothetical protein
MRLVNMIVNFLVKLNGTDVSSEILEREFYVPRRRSCQPFN